jgi:transglutaminase-like putative cysteine protease
MKHLTVRAVQNQTARNQALDILRFTGASDPATLARAIFNWILTHVTVVDEYEELLIPPDEMIMTISRTGYACGDCDDVAMLSAALLCSVGAQCRFMAINRQADGSYGHVLTQYHFPKGDIWENFDPTVGYTVIRHNGDAVIMDIIS